MNAGQVIGIARSQLGATESPANSNRTKYGKWYGMDGQPWCAMFLSWCFDQGGMPLPITTVKGFAYCPYGVNWFKKQGRWYSAPQPGDLVFYAFGGGVADHVGIVVSVTSTTILTVEGNTSFGSNTNGGSVMLRTRQRSLALGYGRPNYSDPATLAVAGSTIKGASVADDIVWIDEILYTNKDGYVTKTRLDREGNISNFGTPFFGSMGDVKPEGKLGFVPASLTAINADDPQAGYIVWNTKGEKFVWNTDTHADLKRRGLLAAS